MANLVLVLVLVPREKDHGRMACSLRDAWDLNTKSDPGMSFPLLLAYADQATSLPGVSAMIGSISPFDAH
jgi:hypothetical protein